MANNAIKLNRIRMLMLFIIVLSLASLSFGGTITVQLYVRGQCANNSYFNASLYLNNVLDDTHSDSTNAINSNLSIGLFSFQHKQPNTEYKLEINANAHSPCTASGFNSTVFTTLADVPVEGNTIVKINVTIDFTLNLTYPKQNGYVLNITSFNWSFNYYKAEYCNLVVANSSGFNQNSIVINKNITSANDDFNYKLNNSNALAEGEYYWKVLCYDSNTGAKIKNSETRHFIVDMGLPRITNIQPGNNTWYNTSPMTLSFDTDYNSECRFNQINNSDFYSKSLMDNTNSQSHSTQIFLLNQGVNWFYIQCKNNLNGLIGEELDYKIYYDNNAPNISNAYLRINNGESYTLQTNLNIIWGNFSDNISGIKSYYYSFDGPYINETSSLNTFLNLSNINQGKFNIFVWAKDNADNPSNVLNSSTIIDTLPPEIYDTSWTDLTRYSNGTFTIITKIKDNSPLKNNISISYNYFGTKRCFW
jgi:hypothetical protein